jgi:hypothetical protein
MTPLAFIGLTLKEIFSGIPHDLGALIAYALLLAFVGFTWYGSRKPATEPGPTRASGDDMPHG